VGTASEALLLGSLIFPALEAAVSILKSKLPKKSSPEINSKIVLPLRDTLKKLALRLEGTKSEPKVSQVETDWLNPIVVKTVFE